MLHDNNVCHLPTQSFVIFRSQGVFFHNSFAWAMEVYSIRIIILPCFIANLVQLVFQVLSIVKNCPCLFFKPLVPVFFIFHQNLRAEIALREQVIVGTASLR